MATIELRGITKRFGDVTAVSNLDLTVPEGSFFSLLGPSGCGKTTILRMIAGFERPTSGRILIDGRDITDLPPQARNVGLVFQSYALFPHLTVFENIAYGLRVRGLTNAQLGDRVDRYMELVQLPGLADRRMSELSGGQQQRVALARSLAIEPALLLLDEPLSNLDARLRDDMRAELKRIHQTLKRTTIYVTHDQGEALSLSDRVAVFRDGVCHQEGAPAEVYATPNDSFVAQFVGDSNVFDASPVAGGLQLAPGMVIRTSLESPRILIRPEAIALALAQADAGVADDTTIAGQVESADFGGASTLYRVRADRVLIKVLRVNQPGDTPLIPGTPVRLHIAPAAVRPLCD